MQTTLFRENKQALNIEPEGCVFCGIAKGEVPSHTVFKDDISLAFLDRRPLFLGHCLLIPLSHYETFSDLPQNLVGPLFTNAKLLATAVERALGADGTFVAINNKVSQSVPHLHIHIVPRRFKDGLKGFFWPRHRYESEQAALEVQTALQREISR